MSLHEGDVVQLVSRNRHPLPEPLAIGVVVIEFVRAVGVQWWPMQKIDGRTRTIEWEYDVRKIS